MECTIKIQGREVTIPLDIFKNHLTRVLDTKQKLGIEAKVDPAIRVGSSGLDMSIREVSANPDTKIKDRIQKVMNRVIQELETKLEREIDFEDFLDVNINDTTKGPKWTFDNYSKLKAMWESTGREAEDIHDDYFSTDLLLDELTDIGFNFVDDQTYSNATPNTVIESKKEEIKKEVQKNPAPQVEEQTDAEIEDAIEEEYYGDYSNEKIENDKYKNLGDDDGRQTSDSPTPANLGLLYTSDIDGNVLGDVRPNDSPNMDNSVWLNPNELGVGSELVVMPPQSFEEVMNVEVGDWQYNDSTGEWKRHGSITFGELVARDGIVVGSQEYISRVPMKAYTQDGREAMWIRDMAWINPNNYSSLINKAEVIKTVRQKTFNIRNTAFQNGKTTIRITKRDFGSYTTFDKMNSSVTNRPEQEVHPTSIPVIATSFNSFKFNGQSYNIGDPNSEVQILNPSLYPGSTYSLRYYGTEINSNGIKVKKYLAVILRPNIPTKEETLNRNAHNNIKYGVSAVFYMKAFRDYQAGKISKEVLDVVGNRLGMNEVKASHLINSINNTYRVNIESFSRIGTGGMSDFLNNFTAVYTGKKNGNYKDALTSADSERFPDGQAYLYISSNASGDMASGGQFGINIKGKASASTQRGDMDDFGGTESYTYPLNPKNGSAKYYDVASKYLENVLGDTGSLSKMRFDPSSQYIGDRSLVLNIDDNGEIQGTSSYDNYVKSNMVTNVAAFKVETSPGVYTYVTDMQPSMAFEQVDSNVDITPITNKPSIKAPVPPVEPPVPPKAFESLGDEMDNLPDELKALLGDSPFVGLEKDIYLKAKENKPSNESNISIPKSVTHSKEYGVVSVDTDLTDNDTKRFISVIQPQIKNQSYRENKSSTANDMFSFGLRWTRKSKAFKPLINSSYANKGLPTNSPLAKDGYVYDTVDQNNRPLAPISDLNPIIEQIEKSLGLDMSNYDTVLGNIYLPGQRITTHRDTTESLSARNYPVIVYTLGNDSGINIYESSKPGGVSFASDKSKSIKTKNGSIYTFGLGGKGRFELAHDTPEGIKRDKKFPPITLSDGRVVENYTITLTFRRSADLTEGMDTSPKSLNNDISNKEKSNDLDFSLRELTDSDVTKVESISTNRIKGVDPVQQKIIVQGLYNVILEELGRSDKYDVSSLNKLIVKSPEKYLRPELNKTQSAMDKFYADPSLMTQFPKVFSSLKIKRDKLTAILDNQSKITSLEEGNVGDLTNTFQKFFQEEIEESDVQEQDDVLQQDETGEVEEQYDKDMMTKDITTSFSTDLQIFFSGIPKRDKFNKQEKTFFTGLKEYEDSKNVVGALRAIMANEDSDLNGLMQRLADKSATNPIYIGLHNKLKLAPFKVKMEILYKMNQDRLQMQSLLVEKRNGLEVTVVDPNNNESFVAHRIDWSANMVHNGQVTDTLDSGEVVYNKEKIESVIKQAQEILQEYNEFTKGNEKVLGKKLLAGEDIGIPEELNKKLWDYMTVTYGIDVSPEAYSQFIRDNFLNLNVKNKGGFLALTLERLNNLNKTLDRQEKVFFDDKRDGLQSNINDLLRSISEIESYYIGNPVPKSFRTDGKTYQGTVQKTMVSKLVDKIKDTSSDYFKNLSLIPYSKNNYILDAIARDPIVRNKYGIRYMGPKALAEKGKKYRKSESRKINALAEADTTLVELGFFAETEGVINYQVVGKEKVKFRLARMFNPTLSDKSQAVFYTIPVVDLRAENIDILDDTLHLDNQVEEFLVEQIFDAELERIVSVLRHKPNISNYKDAGVFFNSIAGFNNIIVEETTAGTTDFVNIISYIHNIVNSDIEQGRETDVESLKTDLRNYALVQMSQALSEEISRKVNDWKRLGIVRGQSVMLSNGETAFAKHLFPNRYFESKNYSFKDDAERNEKEPYLFAADFVINNFLNQNNTYQLIAGDIALYAKGKSKPKEMVEAEFETGVITPDGEPVTIKVKNYKLKDVVKFLKTTGENVTKRMAALIAPGSELANSKDDKYIQIFINDVNNATSVSTELIKQAYGEIDKEGKGYIFDLNIATDELINIYATVPLSDPSFDAQVSDAIDIIDYSRKQLAKKYPNLGGYFSIDAADAQEYTTWREHLDILMRQGRLDKPERDLVVSAYEKLSKGKEVNAEELAVVMNPIKPVYTGPMAEYAKDPITGADILTEPIAMRTVYIKSSSFPLLPQLTAGMALDKTRQHMEHIETKTGKNVRLSYESANKVGHVKSSLTTADLYNFSPEEIFNFNTDTNVFSGKLGEAALVLDREFFKIQQDTPNKTAKYLKKGKDNMVTMGSQMWKLLMGNGINVHEKLVFPVTFDLGLLSILEEELGREIPRRVKRVKGRNVTYVSGVTLDAIKTLVENRYFNTQKEILFTELGLNEDGLSVNPDETKRALKEIIDRELKTGSYPQYATDEIDLSQIDTGDLDFTQPIWMTNNADKFETLLQGIITSRLIKIKMPGNQHISASSEGFWKGKNYTDRGGILGLEDLSPDIQSTIVWTNPSKRGELKPTILKNGTLQASEALIGSHFRMQVQEKDKEGNPILDSRGKPKFKTKLVDLTQAPYSKRDADGYLYLDLNMIDEGLLEQFSFRIPTSSHQSGAMLKIVGFLPKEMGDILVVPKEHTVQIGEDFDIDKRNIYKNHYTISKRTGKIQKLSATRFLEPYDAKEFAEAGFLYNMRRINKKIAEDQYLKLISLEHQLEALESVKEEKFKEEAATTFLDDDIYELQSQIDGLRDVLLTQDFSSSPEPDKSFADKITKSKERYVKVVGPMYDKLEKYHKVKAAQKTRTTFYEDSMVNLYKSVFISPSKDIQNKVNKVLSMDVADNTANAIYNKIFASSDSTGFTTYSDSFQREQQKLGAAGKLGIGQHSNAVTFQAQLERMVSKIKISRDIRLGKLVSDGVLGVSNTLDKQYKIDNNKDIGASRDVADVHTENQNSATDNVKAQIMGKRNENEFTMGVLTMLTYRRFDQDIDPIEEGGSDFYQVPSLFISQPALRKYVEYMEANKAVPNNNVLSPNEVMIKLYNEYASKLSPREIAEYFSKDAITEKGTVKVTNRNKANLFNPRKVEELRARMTGQFLYDNLVETSPLMALASLDLFNELKNETDALTEYQKLINMNTSGLGLSYFEVLDREETLVQMLNDDRFENISKLVTNDFMTESQASELSEDELKDYYYVRGYYIKPSTTEGVVLLNSITSANSVINNLYPYKSQGIRRIYSKLQQDSTNLKEDRVRMIRELKDFMLSTSNTGFFEGSVTDERERLMVDAPGKQSLASFLKNMHKRRDDLFMENDLLKDFRFNLVSQRGYSYINHAAGGKSPSDKNDKAKAFIDLLQDSYTDIGEWNGEKMTPQKLALNLYNYSMLTANDQGISSFREYLPNDLDKIYGLDAYKRSMDAYLKTEDSFEMLDRFYTQFMQHNLDIVPGMGSALRSWNALDDSSFTDVLFANPNVETNSSNYIKRAVNSKESRRLTLKDYLSTFAGNIDQFAVGLFDDTLNDKRDLPSVIKVPYVIKSEEGDTTEYATYKVQLDGEKVFFNKIDGFNSEYYESFYDLDKDQIYKPNVSNTYTQRQTTLGKKEEPKEDFNQFIDPKTGKVSTLESFFGYKPTAKQAIAKVMEVLPENNRLSLLLKTIDSALLEANQPSLEIIEDSVDGVKVHFGAYSHNNNKIYLNNNLISHIGQEEPLSNMEVIAEVLAEELLHSLQVEALSMYVQFNTDGTYSLYNPSTTPPHVKRILDLYEEAKLKGLEGPEMKNVKEFIAAIYTRPDFRVKLDNSLESWRVKFMQALRQALQDIFEKSAVSLPNGVKPSDYLRENINLLLGDTFRMQDEIAQETLGEGYISNGFRIATGIGVSNTFGRGTNKFINETDDSDYSKRDSFTATQMNDIINKVISGAPMTILSTGNRDSKAGVAQTALMKALLERVGKIEGTSITSRNASRYFTVDDNGSVVTIKYKKSQQTMKFPDINENCS